MKTLPEIGSTVRCRSVSEYWDRECVGEVKAHYPGYYDDDGVRPVGSDEWEEHWSASVEVIGELPDWWSHPGTRRFAPPISEIELA